MVLDHTLSELLHAGISHAHVREFLAAKKKQVHDDCGLPITMLGGSLDEEDDWVCVHPLTIWRRPKFPRPRLLTSVCPPHEAISIVMDAMGWQDAASFAMTNRSFDRLFSEWQIKQKHIELRWVEPYISGAASVALDAIADACPGLLSLEMHGCRGVSDNDVQVLAESCTRLQQLVLDGCKCLTNAAVTALAGHCHDLQHVHLTYNHLDEFDEDLELYDEFPDEPLSDAGLQALAESCPHLRHVHVRFGTSEVSSATLHALATRCRHLQHVDIRMLVDDHSRDKDAVRALAASCVQLRHLNLDFARITDLEVMVLAYGCQQLQHVSLQHCGMFTDTGLIALAVCCGNLQYIGVCGCQRINDAVFPLAMQQFPNLRISRQWSF
jgi:hypothetical protein